MTTPNIVPRSAGGGSLGTVDKRWGAVHSVDATVENTPSVGDSSKKVANTEYVDEVALVMAMLFS